MSIAIQYMIDSMQRKATAAADKSRKAYRNREHGKARAYKIRADFYSMQADRLRDGAAL